MKKLLKITFSVLLTTMLVGCFSTGNNYKDTRDKHFSREHSRVNIAKLSSKLSAYNVNVVQKDTSIVLILPAKDFFVDGSANFSSGISGALDLILGMTNYYDESSISITGYSKNISNDKIGKALAIERAHKIESYLWRSRIVPNFISANGVSKVYDDAENKNVMTDCVVIEINNYFE